MLSVSLESAQRGPCSWAAPKCHGDQRKKGPFSWRQAESAMKKALQVGGRKGTELAKRFAHFWKLLGRLSRLKQHKGNACVCVYRGREIREKRENKIAEVSLHKHIKVQK